MAYFQILAQHLHRKTDKYRSLDIRMSQFSFLLSLKCDFLNILLQTLLIYLLNKVQTFLSTELRPYWGPGCGGRDMHIKK
jgi:hypothetical protein